MMLSEKQIREVAGELDSGMRCFYNPKTKEIVTLPGEEFRAFLESDGEDLMLKEIEEIENNIDDYFEFEAMDSTKSFRVMESFAETVDDKHLKMKLIWSLENRKPFANFKNAIDNSGEYRQQWFDYKAQKYFEFIAKQLRFQNNTDEEDE